jgi:hypothetical protein
VTRTKINGLVLEILPNQALDLWYRSVVQSVRDDSLGFLFPADGRSFDRIRNAAAQSGMRIGYQAKYFQASITQSLRRIWIGLPQTGRDRSSFLRGPTDGSRLGLPKRVLGYDSLLIRRNIRRLPRDFLSYIETLRLIFDLAPKEGSSRLNGKLTRGISVSAFQCNQERL